MTTKFEQCKSNIKRTWNILNEVLGRTKRDTTSEFFKIDQEKISDPKLIANHFNTFFVNIGSRDNNTDDNGFNEYLGHEQHHNFKFDTITNNETIRIITKIKSKHSCGHDSISTALLKQIKTEISPSITLIVNQCLTTGIFPNKLKIAKVVPVFKKGDKDLLNNYRPISMLPSISKIFETVIYNQLYEYLQEHRVITNSQYGFRKKHSTEYTAIELVDRIIEKLDRNKVPFNIYIDLSKAFDMIDHNILLFKLNHYGIRNGALNLLKSYFTGRKQYCHFRSTDSAMLNIHKGVPQGSILGPLLFILYINDFIYSTDKFDFLMYAGDTTLFSTYDKFESIDDKNIETIENNINKELSLIVTWLHRNKLLINTTKTKMTIFHTPHRKVTYPRIKINNSSVEVVDEFKFLGIFIDKHLKWSTHTEFIANKISKYTRVINRLKHTLPPRILLTLYNTLILPHLHYGLLLWGHYSDRIFKLQKRAIRTISNSKFNGHTEPICKLLSILKLPDLYKLQLYKMYYKIKREVVPQYFTTVVPTLTHNYFTRRTADQRNRTYHAFADHNCLHAMIDLLNKSPLIKAQVTTSTSLPHFVSFVKQQCFRQYEYFCSVNNCYVCNGN